MTKSEFVAAMSYLISAYPAANISGATSNVYFEHLKDIPIATMEKAAARIVECSRFFPSVAEIREECQKIERPEYNKTTVDAIALINSAVSKFGRYRTAEAMEYIKNNDAVLYQIVKAVRFENICGSDIRNYRNEIEKLYKESSEDMRREDRITGITMADVMRLGKKMEYAALAAQKEEF